MGNRWLVSTIGMLCAALLTQGCASTAWIKRTPQQDGQYKYYVGRSYHAKSPTEALEVARADAKIRAVESNFGVQFKSQTDSHETIDAAQVIARSRAISKSVHLEAFEEVESHSEDVDDDQFNGAVLFRYSKTAINKEKDRLAKNPQQNEDIKFEAVDTTPRTPTRANHGAVLSTFVIGAGVGGQGPTMKDVDNSMANFRLQGEWRLSRYVGLDAFGEFGNKSISYTNGALAMKKDVVGLGMPLYLSSADRSSWTTFLEPTVQAVRTGFSFTDSSGNSTSSVSKWQFGPGINLGTQVRFVSWEKIGLSVRPQVGAYFPMANSGVSGATAFQGSVILQWEFFKK